jgi:hypothetical protein
LGYGSAFIETHEYASKPDFSAPGTVLKDSVGFTFARSGKDDTSRADFLKLLLDIMISWAGMASLIRMLLDLPIFGMCKAVTLALLLSPHFRCLFGNATSSALGA